MSIINEADIREVAAREGVTHFATGVAIFRDGKLLVVRRIISDSLGGFYELPGGGVDDGETFTEGAIRETFEETGLKVKEIIGTFEGFDYSTSSKPKVRQINIKVTVELGEVVLNPLEHDDYRFINREEIRSLNTSDEMKICLSNAFDA